MGLKTRPSNVRSHRAKAPPEPGVDNNDGAGVRANNEEGQGDDRVEADPGTVDEYIAGLDGTLGAIVQRLRELIHGVAPRARESIRWGMPHYAQSGHLVYIDAKEDHVNLGFFRGDELAAREHAKALFLGAGGKLRYIKLFSPDTIPEDGVRDLVAAAVARNRDISEF